MQDFGKIMDMLDDEAFGRAWSEAEMCKIGLRGGGPTFLQVHGLGLGEAGQAKLGGAR